MKSLVALVIFMLGQGVYGQETRCEINSQTKEAYGYIDNHSEQSFKVGGSVRFFFYDRKGSQVAGKDKDIQRYTIKPGERPLLEKVGLPKVLPKGIKIISCSFEVGTV